MYVHFDPDTKEILYVGMGVGQRAYTINTSKISDVHYIHRSPEHCEHLKLLMSKGYLPHEWIDFRHKCLDKDTARKFEKELIKELKPKYNRKHGIKIMLFDEIGVREIFKLRKEGLYYHQIAEKMGCSTMVAHRILNNKSPNYQEIIDGIEEPISDIL